MPAKACLIIMDGWGEGKKNHAINAIRSAKTPFTDSLYQKYPHSELLTHGEDVGLPAGQMGNSEVGHINIGAGRVVYQELLRIKRVLEHNELLKNENWKQIVHYTKSENKSLHLMGLLSDGGVHSHINHLLGLIKLAVEEGISKIYIHAFTDGRDTDPQSGKGFIEKLENAIAIYPQVELVTVIGRYFAMDRDNRWERIKKAYDALISGIGQKTRKFSESIQQSYENGVTDEFMEPMIKNGSDGEIIGRVKTGDAVLVFNFRTDRCRQLTRALTREDFPELEMKKLSLHFTTLTRYDKTFDNVHVLFKNEPVSMTLGEILEKSGKTQLRAAETEKYPHVTFFFSGGREIPFKGEERIMISSPKVATYDMKPEMSAYELTDSVINYIETKQPDFICLNFANADMVGHTGDFHAVVKAVETVDQCVEKVVLIALLKNYTVFLTADHGNADNMVNKDGSPNTAHSTNPVPLFVLSSSNQYKKLENGKLGDLAPTMLNSMGVEIPDEMTGKDLLS